jgi:hypothetical protein
MNFKLTGPAALVVVVGILLVFGGRIVSRGETDDPRLEREVRQELMIRQGMATGQELDRLTEGEVDREAVARLTELSDAEGIRIHSMKVSAPLGSSDQRIVEVEFTLPGQGRLTEYWVFDRRGLGGWDYRRRTTKLSYYLNFF